ncbi:MAG: hypothetical protein PHF63_11535 [Herbinix sp.]|nr:hypothetical protein [Herbinix sp.]
MSTKGAHSKLLLLLFEMPLCGIMSLRVKTLLRIIKGGIGSPIPP